ncbi:MAG: hypothetical protein PHC71_02250, partial [Candidatus Omnitrophica bacterium]|nr:hypothetical protein [Candidatus Omnitrophota bacterium]
MKYLCKFLLFTLLPIYCLSFVFLAGSGSNESTHPKAKESYNVILIIIDDLRPDHLGCYGYANQTSPAID